MAAASSSVLAGDDLGDRATPLSGTQLGLGFAAASAACMYGFEELRLTTITADVAVENERSVAILRRLGMREQGEMASPGFRRFVLQRLGG